jgi:hypothetical protein
MSNASFALGKTSCRLGNSWDSLACHVPESRRGPRAALWKWLLVGGGVKGDEEEEVRGQNADSRNGSEFFTSASSQVGKGWEVGGGEVSPGREVDETWEWLDLKGFYEVWKCSYRDRQRIG